MNSSSITLLEICELSRGGRIACCLPRGEFLFVTSDASRFFRAPTASDLFGKNLCDYIVLNDLEKLQDYMRAHYRNGVLSNETSSKLAMAARLVGVSQKVWIRMKTTPISLRLLRCIDSVTVLSVLKNHFSDSSSFVVSDGEMSTIFNFEGITHLDDGCDQGADTNLTIAVPDTYEIPLELKTSSSSDYNESQMGTSPSSPTGLLGSKDESLSDIAFLADWAAEASSIHNNKPRRVFGPV